MSKEKLVKQATVRQMAYIKRLIRETGSKMTEMREPISSLQTSKIIGDLVAGGRQEERKQILKRINEPRLGMAMKEVFRVWSAMGRDVLGERRNAFVNEVLSLYELFIQIAEQLEENRTEIRGIHDQREMAPGAAA